MSKQPRYFYTDPLAAAWMAKHFGMEFTLPASCPDPWNAPGHSVYWMTLADMHCGGFYVRNPDRNGSSPIRFCEEIKPLYVHPGSLHLLEPRPGDTLTNIGAIGWRLTAINGDKLIFHDCHGRREEMTILQRAGIPFHWPEVEP